MSYALVIDNAIVEVRNPSRHGETKLSDGATIRPDPEQGWTDGLAALCGFLPITDPGKPADTPTTVWEPTVTGGTVVDGVDLVAGVPTRVWTERNKTQAEIDADTAAAQLAADIAEDDAAIADIIANALATLDTFANFQGNANNSQLTSAVKDVSRILARLVRALDRRNVI